MILNKNLLRSAITAALGGLLFGFDTAVIAGTTYALTARFALSPFQLGFTVSTALWGTVLGAICAGGIGQRLGSRATLRIMAFLYVLSALGCALAWSWPSFLLARFLGGVGIGGSSVLGPVYIAELAPPKFRGRLVGLFQVNIVVGIMLAYLSNFVIASFHLGAQEWRWEFGVAALPALLFMLMLFAVPDSPRWLVMRGRIQEALGTLIAIGTPNPESDLDAIIGAVHQTTASNDEQLFQSRYGKPILLAVSLAIFNQLSGINAVLYYANDIFVSAGFSRLAGGLQAIVVGAVNLLFTFVAMALIDKLGRKILLVIGSAGMTIALSGIAIIFVTGHWRKALIFFVAGFIASFATSSGSVIWVYMSEIFPTRIRVKGQALGSTVLWVMNGLVSQLFPLLSARSASLPFVCFAVVMAVQCVVTLLFFPETKALSLEELQQRA
jgi:SP family arabinose:H+ symporter-like MFS transporter